MTKNLLKIQNKIGKRKRNSESTTLIYLNFGGFWGNPSKLIFPKTIQTIKKTCHVLYQPNDNEL